MNSMISSFTRRRTWRIVLLIFLPLICIAGIVFSFARLYQRDMQALAGFMAAYQVYGQSVAVLSASVSSASGSDTPTLDAEELRADAALAELKTRPSIQISSLIKNEKEAMCTMQEIAELSAREMNSFKAFRQSAGQGANRDNLAQAFHDLTRERQSAFPYFQELGR